jgi:hypothetical protein
MSMALRADRAGIEPLGIHCIGRYAMRRGVPRYLDMLDRNGVPATFFVCATTPSTIGP